MKKLTKKQEKIIANINDSIATNLHTLRKFHAEHRIDLVSHCQEDIKAILSGISSYLIHSNHVVWDKPLSDAYWEIRDMHELSLDYWMEVSKSEHKVYGAISATA